MTDRSQVFEPGYLSGDSRWRCCELLENPVGLCFLIDGQTSYKRYRFSLLDIGRLNGEVNHKPTFI